MTYQATDLKLFSQVRDYLTQENDDKSSKQAGKPAIGSFTYFSFPMPPKNPYDEVYKGILLGDATLARKPEELKKIGITHVVNMCMGTKFNQVDTNAEFYKDVNITFHGIQAVDVINFKLTPYFQPASEFIDKALRNEEHKIYVHCQQGVSRSATIVLAFLMIKREMDLLTAVKLVRQKREIFPNEGFLKQLCRLNMELYEPEKLQNKES